MARLTDEQQQMYTDFRMEFDHCWFCPWRPGLIHPRLYVCNLEIDHIVRGQGRKADRRCIVMACTECHMLRHGARIRIEAINSPYPPQYAGSISQGQLIWMKERMDPEWYDPDYLDRISIGIAEEPLEYCYETIRRIT